MLCKYHFNVKPIINRWTWEIEGYTSKIILTSKDLYTPDLLRGSSTVLIEPTYDLD